MGRKDRHSKVCTSKGPRDRRVRLAAHTAIQFYDVQDRLGYDRPSKAVDWLIKKAKASIDKLPTWNRSSGSSMNVNFKQGGGLVERENQQQYLVSIQNELAPMNMNPSFALPPSDAIFPTSSSAATNFHHMNQLYQISPSYHTSETTVPPGWFDGTPGWQQSWCTSGGGGSGRAAEWLFDLQPVLVPELGQKEMFSQRGPLQSNININNNNTPLSFHAWMDYSPALTTIAIGGGGGDHIQQVHHHTADTETVPTPISGFGFSSELGTQHSSW